jgi:hypothetical protein
VLQLSLETSLLVDFQGILYSEFVHEGQNVKETFYVKVLFCMRDAIWPDHWILARIMLQHTALYE